VDPQIESLLAGMPDADRAQLARDVAEEANRDGVELTDELAEAYVRQAFAADHEGQAPEQAYAEPEPYVDPRTAMFGDYGEAAREQRQAEANSQRFAEQAGAQADELRRQIGRDLTSAEIAHLADELDGQMARRGEFDVTDAASTVGIKPWREMSDHDVAATMAQRMRDMAGPEPDLEIPLTHGATADDPLRPDWGQMTDDAANRYMAARLAGAEIEHD
jgi:hypothetical protein